MIYYAKRVDGIIAQSIAVALHGSAWLATRGALPALEVNNSTFHYVSLTRFENLAGDRVDGADAWLEQLAAAGVTEVDIYLPDEDGGAEADLAGRRQRAAFVDDDVGLCIPTGSGGRLWRAEWRTRHHDPLAAPRPDARPWSVTYRESAAPTRLRRPALDATRHALIQAIEIAIGFAREHEMNPLDATLARARELETAERPQPPFYADMAPAGVLSLERQRLLAIATGAHVFGGMGTWNDFSFSDHETQRIYNEVSDGLFTAVMRGFSASVNTRTSET